MADKPWPELYVSFCMKTFIPPSLELLSKTVLETEPPLDLIPRLEKLVGMSLVQEPCKRARISEIFEVLMTMVIEHGSLTPPKLINCHSDSGNSVSTSSMNHTLEPRHVSSVLLSMKNLLSAKQASRWSLNKTFNVVRWGRETSKLRPRSLDFRCGSGLVITLLNKEDIVSINGTNNGINEMKNATNGGTNGNSRGVSEKNTNKSNQSNQSNQNNQSNQFNQNNQSNQTRSNTLPSNCHNLNSASHPYLTSTFLGGSYNQDLSCELNGRIEYATKMIATTSLVTCAKNLAQKSVVNFVRDEGVFRIEISCGPHARCNEDMETKRNYFLRGIERLVLPVWCGTSSDIVDEETEMDFMDDIYSDAVVMKSIDRLLNLAKTILSEPIPPAILITIVPYTPPIGRYFFFISHLFLHQFIFH